MSKSFQLQGGDLVVVGRSFGIVAGSQKLQQDLVLWVYEKLGIDPATPSYGNVLDGGWVNGVAIPSMIGQITSQDNILEIQGIIQNLLTQYQQMQLAKISTETLQYGGKTTLTPDEILQTVNSVTASSSGDIVVVQADITTMAGAQLTVTVPIQA